MIRILFDQATPAPLRHFLTACIVRTAAQLGWDRLENGKLIATAEEAGFDILLSTDKNIRYQQNLEARKISLIILEHCNWPDVEPHVEPHVEAILAAVNASTPGSYIAVPIPFRQ